MVACLRMLVWHDQRCCFRREGLLRISRRRSRAEPELSGRRVWKMNFQVPCWNLAFLCRRFFFHALRLRPGGEHTEEDNQTAKRLVEHSSISLARALGKESATSEAK